MGIEQEIVKHLELCAALMSDPQMLRKHPGIVADQFLAAKGSIEALGVFLQPRPEDKCDCHAHGWMDLGVIKNGIGQLVAKTLATHLGIVRLDKFPCVVEVDFKSVVDVPGSENYTIREIKETNCMGSIVLLYYYLYWYLFLIRMNQRIDPLYCTESQLNIDRLISGLPKAREFLEFRSLGGAFVAVANEDRNVVKTKYDALQNARVTGPFMFPAHVKLAVPNGAQNRKTMLIAAYRRALATNLRTGRMVDAYIEFPDVFENAAPSLVIYDTITVDTILRGMTAMGGMASVFERGDAIQKWKDMHAPVPVAGKDGVEVSKYNGKIGRILSGPPYSVDDAHWKENGTKACVYDYCSAALMMDVCRSFQKLAELVGALASPASPSVATYLHLVLRDLAGYSAEVRALTEHLQTKRRGELVELDEKDQGFVDRLEADLTFYEATHKFQKGSDRKTISLWLDEFKSLYPTRQTGVSGDFNRRTFLLDFGVGEEGCSAAKWLAVVQSEMIACKLVDDADVEAFNTAYALVLIATFMRNSCMVTRGGASLTELMKKAVHSPGFINLPVLYGAGKDMYSKDPTNHQDRCRALHDTNLGGFTSVLMGEFLSAMVTAAKLKEQCDFGAYTAGITALNTKVDGMQARTTTLAEIESFALAQQKTLSELTTASTRFDRHPALMWQVTYKGDGDGDTTNIKRFDKIRDRSRRRTADPTNSERFFQSQMELQADSLKVLREATGYIKVLSEKAKE